VGVFGFGWCGWGVGGRLRGGVGAGFENVRWKLGRGWGRWEGGMGRRSLMRGVGLKWCL
jgi:hypothetical protein